MYKQIKRYFKVEEQLRKEILKEFEGKSFKDV